MTSMLYIINSMKETASVSPQTAVKRQPRRLLLRSCAFMLGLVMINAPTYLTEIESPWLKIGIIVLPWAALSVLVVLARRAWREDELEMLIGRRAFTFAASASFVGLLAVYQLQSAGFVPAIEWTTRGLVTGLAVLMFVGLVIAKLRYR